MRLNTAKLLIRADDNLWIFVIIIKKYLVLPLLLLSLVFFLPARFYIEALQRPTSRVAPLTGAISKTNENTLKTQNLAVNSTQNVQIERYVASEAQKVGVNPKLATCIVQHESQFNPTKAGKDTGNTISRGLWQWNDYWHPEISSVCAYDAVCATTKALAWIKSGHVSQWSTYHEYCSNIPIYEK